jgi:Mrp family chromosome partitioning ATPase
MNTEVIGVLPLSKELRAFQATANGRNPGSGLMLPDDSSKARLTGYNEAIRTLRNSIFLTDFDRRVRTLMLTSPSPSEGKSTISAHLAMANAQQGRKTLLIDADLRRPSVHRNFSIPNAQGLSNVLNHSTAVAICSGSEKPSSGGVSRITRSYFEDTASIKVDSSLPTGSAARREDGPAVMMSRFSVSTLLTITFCHSIS